MVDFENALEPLLAWDRLLKPVQGSCPSGVFLRNTAAYDELRKSLRPQDSAPGAYQSDQNKTDYRALIRTASDLLATQSKDLDIAVWLTEAMVREYRLPGLSEGILLIQRLIESFWDTVYPELDSGDEGFRAKPINRLNTAFNGALQLLPVTFDGRTVYEYNASADVPSEEKAKQSELLQKKRAKALADGVISPEDMERSVEETVKNGGQFYEDLAEEVRHAADAANLLQKTCDEKFKTNRPILGKLADQLERVRVTVEAIQRTKVVEQAIAKPPEPPRAPPPQPVPLVESTPQQTKGPLTLPLEIPSNPVASEPRSVLDIAAELRRKDPSDPVPYMLTRSWQFGPMLARGAVDEQTLEPPGTELRTSIRRALLNSEWGGVLEHAERAMEASCGCCWLDIQQYSTRACQELGYAGAANAIRGMTAAYLRSLPNLAYAVMLDGSPTANADTLLWIRSEVLADPDKARTESLDEVRPVEFDSPVEGKGPDAFEVAENELGAGRFSEAFRVLTEALAREQSGRGRMQRKIQLSKICMEGGQSRIALVFLKEIWGVIEERRLESWEAPEFVIPPMAMLYKCFDQVDEGGEQRQRIYDKLCAVDPLKALELAGRP